jgi:hypothetical protein
MKKITFSAFVLLCCLTGFAHAQEDKCYNQPIPKEYGRLVTAIGAGRSSCLLFFEANDGIIRVIKVQAKDRTHYKICRESLDYTINRN